MAVSQHITRRLFLRNSAVAGAVAAIPPTAEATTRAHSWDCWKDLIASLGDRVPEGAKVRVWGHADIVHADVVATVMEQVHPNMRIPVDRLVGAYDLTPEGWVQMSVL